MEDLAIIEDCKKGKSYALDLVYEQYAGLMLGVCLRYCNNKGEAEDVLQEGFIKVFLNIKNFDYKGNGSFIGWMKRIMVNTALNHNRDNLKHWFHADIYDLEEYLQPKDEPIEKEKIALSEKEIMALVQELPAGYKAVFNLFVFEKYGHKEIGEMLGISDNTSKSQLNKARKFLQNKITELNKIKIANTEIYGR